MKKKDLNTIRSKKVEDLKKILEEKENTSSMLYARIKAQKEKDTSKNKKLRREIAQISSIIREKELLEVGKEEK